METLELAYIDLQPVSPNEISQHLLWGSRLYKLTMTLEGGHGKSAKLKDFVASGGILARFQTGHSIVDSSPGANASTVDGMKVPIGPHLSAAHRELKRT